MESYSVRAILLTHRKTKKGCPINICITLNRKRIYTSTGFYCQLSDFDTDKGRFKNNYPNAGLINARIKEKISTIEAGILQDQLSGRHISLSNVKRSLNGYQAHNFSTYAKAHIKFLKGKFAPGTIFNYENETGKLYEYDKDVTFDQIDNAYLKKYETWLRSKKLSENSIHKNWKFLKAVFNAAIKDKITTNYPFSNYDNPKYREPDKDYLTESEVEQIEKIIDLPMNDYMYRTACFFLLGVYSSLRFSDWIRFNPSFIREDRLILRAKKNGGIVAMKIHTRLQKAVDRCLVISNKLDNQRCNMYLKGIAELAGINKSLSTHTGRRSFAVICATLGISEESCAELMGISVRVVKTYYKVTGVKLDSDMEKWK